MSLVLTVCRYQYTDEQTRGLYYIGGTFGGYTLENTWKDNETNVSCIPTGDYPTEIREASESASRDYDHLILRDVQKRTYILWHIGNYEKNTEGCILPGKTAETHMVGHSGKAFEELMEQCRKADEITTRVTDINFSEVG